MGRQSGKVWVSGVLGGDEETDDTTAMAEDELELDDKSSSGARENEHAAYPPSAEILYGGKGTSILPAKLCSRAEVTPIDDYDH